MPYVGLPPSQMFLSGLGAKAKSPAVLARQQAHAAKVQLREVTVAGRRLKVHPKDTASSAKVSAQVTKYGQQIGAVKSAIASARTRAQKAAILPHAVALAQTIMQNLSPSMRVTALKGAANTVRGKTARAVKRSRLSGLGQLAFDVAGLLGIGDDGTGTGTDTSIADGVANDPSLSIDPNDPNSGAAGGGYYAGGAPASYGGGYGGGYDPSSGYASPYQQPYPTDPNAALASGCGNSSSSGDPMSSMMSLIPGLMTGGSTSATCTNPNLPRCIIAQQAAQTQQNMITIFSMMMNMFQDLMQTTQCLQQQLATNQLSAQQQPYGGYGQQPPMPYGGPMPQQPYQPSYAPPLAPPAYSTDSSQLPPGYSTGGSSDPFSGAAQAPAAIPAPVSVTPSAPGYSPGGVLPFENPPAPQLTFDPGHGLPPSAVNIAPDSEPSPSPQFPQIVIQTPPSYGDGGSDPNISPWMLQPQRSMIQPPDAGSLQLPPAPPQMESDSDNASAEDSGDGWQ